MMDPHLQLANRYFGYLAERFPVMCASDEFHFLPRAQDAIKYYDRMESLAKDDVEETVSSLIEFQQEIQSLANQESDFEKQIDLKLLTASVTGVLTELDKHQTWRHNPLLYLKIAFIGLDHALTKPVSATESLKDRALSRLNAIPALLKQGMVNIDGVPESYHGGAKAMVVDCEQYLIEMGRLKAEFKEHACEKAIQHVLSALKDFGEFLSHIPTVPDKKFATASIEDTLQNHFLSVRNLDEVFEIAVDEWHHMAGRLEKLRLEIDPNHTWQELYHSYAQKNSDDWDTLSLYRQEIDRMCQFFVDIGLCDNDFCQTMVLTETPLYLKSVRSGASFAASLTADKTETSLFYITTHLAAKEAERLLKKRFNREYKFLIAHEAIPGHHMLDSIRRQLKNPVRRQVESALFYEGWASYAEWLLFEYEYINSPMAYLIHTKRRLWRSARCQIDVGLPQGLLSHQDAVSLLTTSGFSRDEAIRQIRRFSLNPGYQLCYYLGSHEFQELKHTYGNQLDSNTFYKLVLSQGEIPFHLIARKLEMEASRSEKNSV